MKGALATGEIANLVCRSIFIMILMLMAKGHHPLYPNPHYTESRHALKTPP